jgi:hypothetical protein
MRERLSWLFIDSQTNNTQDGPFLHKYASPFWPQKSSKTVSIKGEGLLLALHPSLFRIEQRRGKLSKGEYLDRLVRGRGKR